MANPSSMRCIGTAFVLVLLGHLHQCEARGRAPLIQVDSHAEEPLSAFIPASDGAYGSVLKLNDQTFRGNVLREEDDRVVHWMVYWCPDWWEPCQSMQEKYKRLATQWQQELNAGALYGLQVRFARVDCATDKVLCNAMSVDNYPMVQHYTRGQHVASWTDRSNEAGKRLAKWLSSRLRRVPGSTHTDAPGMVTTMTSTIRMALWQEHAAEVLLVLVILAMNCWGVMRSPLLKNKERQDNHLVAGQASGEPEQQPPFVERVLPEEWLCQRQPVESLEL
jgi:hypothetical protein